MRLFNSDILIPLALCEGMQQLQPHIAARLRCKEGKGGCCMTDSCEQRLLLGPGCAMRHCCSGVGAGQLCAGVLVVCMGHVRARTDACVMRSKLLCPARCPVQEAKDCCCARAAALNRQALPSSRRSALPASTAAAAIVSICVVTPPWEGASPASALLQTVLYLKTPLVACTAALHASKATQTQKRAG